MVDEVKDSLGIESMTSVVVSAAIAYVSYSVGAGFTDGGFSASAAGTAATSSAAAGAAAAGALSSVAGQSLAEKPELGASNLNNELSRNINTRSPINFRELVYGRVRKGGQIVFMETNDDEDIMYMVITIASHEIEGVESLTFNDSPFIRRANDNWHSGLITNDGGDLGSYSDAITQVYVHKGNGNATIPSSFASDTSLNSTDHKFHDVAAIFVRLKFDANVWAAGLPNITCVMKGKKIAPIGGGTKRWSNNPAEVIQDYLTDDMGLGLETSEIDTTSFGEMRDYANQTVDRNTAKRGRLRHLSSSNGGSVYVVDKSVNNFRPLRDGDKINFVDGDAPSGLSSTTDYYVATVTTPYKSSGKMQQGIRLATSQANAISGSFATFTTNSADSSHLFDRIGERRFMADGVASTSKSHQDNLRDILASFGGKLILSNGLFKIQAPKWTSPVITFSEEDCLTPLEVRAKPTRDVRFNAASAKLFAPEFNWGAADVERFIVDDFVTEDGGQINQDFDFTFCNNPAQAQRVVRLGMYRSRNDKGVEFAVSLQGLQLDVGDRFQLNNERLGWTDSNPVYFVVSSLSISAGGGRVPTVKISAQEDNSTVYDWDETTEEIVVDPFPDRVLPDPTEVPAISGLSAVESSELNNDGSSAVAVDVSWNQTPKTIVDVVLRLERYDSDSDVWNVTQVITASAEQSTSAQFTGAIGGARYRVVAYATNMFGVRSASATSGEINLTGDSDAPDTPTNLTATGGDKKIVLTWDNPSDLDLRDIIIHRATSANTTYSEIAKVNTTAYTDDLGDGVTRYYKIQARDYSGNTSAFTAAVNASSNTAASQETPRADQGYVYFTAAQSTAPSAPSTADFGNFDFDTGLFASLPTGIQANPVAITEDGGEYYAVRYAVSEATFGGTQTITLQTPFITMNFDGLVTFTNLASELSDSNSATNITSIDGGFLTTDSVKADSIDTDDLFANNVTFSNLSDLTGNFTVNADGDTTFGSTVTLSGSTVNNGVISGGRASGVELFLTDNIKIVREGKSNPNVNTASHWALFADYDVAVTGENSTTTSVSSEGTVNFDRTINIHPYNSSTSTYNRLREEDGHNLYLEIDSSGGETLRNASWYARRVQIIVNNSVVAQTPQYNAGSFSIHSGRNTGVRRTLNWSDSGGNGTWTVISSGSTQQQYVYWNNIPISGTGTIKIRYQESTWAGVWGTRTVTVSTTFSPKTRMVL